MSTKNFIPTIWDDRIFQGYDKKMVFGKLANRRWEGQISGLGDSVRVTEIDDMASSAYTGTVTYTEADDAQKVLLIDKQHYIAKKIGDIDKTQANVELTREIGRKMGIGLADTIDQSVAALYATAGITSGTTSVPISITSANIEEYMSLMGQGFDDNNVGDEGRVAVVRPWFLHKLRLAGVDQKTQNDELFRTGVIMEAFGWKFFKSNNVKNSSTTWYANMFFIEGETLALAEQMNESEALRLEGSFSDAFRKLSVWGVKTMAPDSLGVLYSAPGSET